MLLGSNGAGPEGPERLLTVREAADRLGVRPVTVYKLCSMGTLAHARISHAIRIAPSALEAFIRRRGEGPQAPGGTGR